MMVYVDVDDTLSNCLVQKIGRSWGQYMKTTLMWFWYHERFGKFKVYVIMHVYTTSKTLGTWILASFAKCTVK